MASVKQRYRHSPQDGQRISVHTGTSARINCRISEEVKMRAEAAATLLGQSLTGFTEAALADKAETVLERQQQIELSERDFLHFASLIEHPTSPTESLTAAMRDYKSLQRANPHSNL